MSPSEVARAINAGLLCHPNKPIHMRLNMARVLNAPRPPHNRRTGTRSSTTRFDKYWFPSGAKIPKPTRPNHTLHVDFKEKFLVTGINLEKHMLTITDMFDKSIGVYPTINTRGVTIATILKQHLALHELHGHGPCKHIRFDNAPSFKSDIVQALMKESKIHVSWTPPHKKT